MISETYLIDCMEFMRTLPDKFFDLAVVDPPYGIGESENIRGGTKYGRAAVNSKNCGKKNWDVSPPDMIYFIELKRVSKNQIIWGANHFISRMPIDSSCWIVWDKVTGNNGYADCELAHTSFSSAVRLFKFQWAGMLQGDMGNKERRIHPTQKPVALYKWLLTNYAKPGQKIFDSHMGSQSSRIAAYQMGFDYWGCELDPDYYRDGCKRFDAVIHKKDTTEYVPVEQTGVGQARLF